MLRFAPLLLMTALGYGASSVIFETDFEQLPQGWISDQEWVFGSFGASLCVSVQDTAWTGEFSSQGEPPVTYPVPELADSVVIQVDQWVFLSSGSVGMDASSTALIQLWTSQSGWGDYIYLESAVDTLFTQTVLSTHVLEDIPSGTSLGFRFTGELYSASQVDYAEIIWQVNGMTVTAYGDFTGLGSISWAAIKAGYRR